MQYRNGTRCKREHTARSRGFVPGTLPNLIAGALEVDIYACPSCRRLELFATDAESDEDELPKRTCPNCKNVHDFDYPKCPKCGRNYY